MPDQEGQERILAQLRKLKEMASSLDEADEDSSVVWAQVEHLMETSGLIEQPPEE